MTGRRRLVLLTFIVLLDVVVLAFQVIGPPAQRSQRVPGSKSPPVPTAPPP